MITSPANERVKAIRKLQERKARQKSGLFYIEGLRIVAEAVAASGTEASGASVSAEAAASAPPGAPSPRLPVCGTKFRPSPRPSFAAGRAAIDTLVVAPELLKSSFGQQLVAEQKERGVPVLEVSGEVFQRISLKEGPQGIAAVVRQRWLALEDVDFRPVPPPAVGEIPHTNTWVALDSVADPGNLGTILRTHDAVGGRGVILLDQSTDPYDPAAVRGSMGALFSQELVRATFAEFAAWRGRTGCPVIGTSDKARIDYHAYRYPPELALLMGSERQGLSEERLALCDAVVSIPMLGKSDSLNLAVATAVVLYEILNQRREKE